MLEEHAGHAIAQVESRASAANQVPPARAANEAVSLVEGTPRVRHRHQFEIKLRYPLPVDERKSVYDLAVYFFLPPSLGIGRSNYGKTRFFEDLQSYVRLKTPELLFPDVPRGDAGPLSRLTAAALRLQGDTGERSVRLYEYQSKLFCCVLKSSLLAFAQRIESESNPGEQVRLIEEFRLAASSLRSIYSTLEPRLCNPSMPPSAQSVFRFTDEYISLLLEEYACRIISAAPHDDNITELRKALIDFVKREIGHRVSAGYPSVSNASSENEGFVYRRGVLKKYMSSVLFLNVRSGDAGRFLEEGLFGLAAGVSMVFATAVLFLATQLYGALTFPVFVALVVSYIFKDRIKERMRLYLSRKAARWLFDHRTIFYASGKERIGVCSESVDFLETGDIPAPVAAVRNRSHITEIEGGWVGERAIRYRKLVKLYPVRIADIYDSANIRDVNDIMRFSIEEFVQHLGTADKPVQSLVGDEVKWVHGERVHHLNVIVRHAVNDVDTFQRYRIILNRDGIKRIEFVPAIS